MKMQNVDEMGQNEKPTQFFSMFRIVILKWFKWACMHV
jgi:hypothetical protein